MREHVVAASRGAEGTHLIAAYSRRALARTGDGHDSPIGGHHRERDLVLLIDVARFKYSPHWAPLSLLREAMAPADPGRGRPRVRHLDRPLGGLLLRRSVTIQSHLREAMIERG